MNVEEYKAVLSLYKMKINKYKKAVINPTDTGILVSNRERNRNCQWEKRARSSVAFDEQGVLKVFKNASYSMRQYALIADRLKPIFGLKSSGYETRTSCLVLPFYCVLEQISVVYSSEREAYVVEAGAAKTVYDYLKSFLSGDDKAGEFLKSKDFLKSFMQIVLFRYIIGCSGDTNPANILVDPVTGSLISINELGLCDADDGKLMKMSKEDDVVSEIMNLIVKGALKKSKLPDYFDVNCMLDVLNPYKSIFIGFQERFNKLKYMFN